SIKSEVILPEQVLDFTSKPIEIEKLVLDFLPRDTSFGQRLYKDRDGFETLVNVVLMGTDRTSLHKPQFCLSGQGWAIDETLSTVENVRIDQPHAYDLPVMKLITTKQVSVNGNPVTARGIYVYWFVSKDAHTAQHWQRMWWMARDILRTGVMQRW